jgi:gamma-glutamylcyclotransferase (GGCT)/AIG2-like uncharacterized protein YtfP
MERLFVYGTLRRGTGVAESEWLSSVARFESIGRIEGRLIDLGSYPGIVAAERGWVDGEVFVLPENEEVLRRLDAYEGDEYERVERIVSGADGREVKCWVYWYVACNKSDIT